MRTIAFLLFPGLLFLSTQCKKLDGPVSLVEPMDKLEIPAGFNWQMAHPVIFHVSGTPGTVVQITTPDGDITIHKSIIRPGESNTDITISIPDYIREVLVNGSPVYLSGNDITVKIPQTKALLLTNFNLSFDGTDDYINLGNIAELNGAAAFTIEGWAKQTDNSDAEYIFSKAVGPDNDIRVRTAGGTMILDLGNGSDSYATWNDYSTAISSATWYHWAVVYDGSGMTNADRLKLYIGGNVIPVALVFTGTIPTSTSSGLSGGDSYLSSAFTPFDGMMDEVRIWSVARTSAQVHDCYNVLVPGTTANLAANWHMNEGTGNTAFDMTSGNYDAVISGCTWTQENTGFDSDGDGVSDDEDDYIFDGTRAFINYYPVTDYGTLVFEDIWPSYGDYDFNDLVLGYRFKTVTNALNEVIEIEGTFIVRANGADLHNGFGFELPDANAGIISNVKVTGYTTLGIVTLDGTTHLETGQTHPVIIPFDDTYDLMPGIFNTVNGSIPADPDSVVIRIEITGGGPFTASDFSLDTWNPFIFIGQKRGQELHLLDHPPTDLMTTSYFGTGDDFSMPLTGDYYKSFNNLPWALEFPTSFAWAKEFNAINSAYLHFTAWAESGGTLFPDWYSNTSAGYRNISQLYHP